MAALGSGLMVAGVLTALAGIGGFIDTRKVDRRYRTGYKNNEPDSRNFGRAGKILLVGIGMCFIGGAVNNLVDSHDGTIASSSSQSQIATSPEPVQSAASDTSSHASVVVKLDPNDAQASQQNSDATSSNERVLNSGASPVDAGGPQQMSQAGSAIAEPAASSETQTFSTSFDCRRATHDDEAAICGDAGLAAMDRQLSQLYGTTMKTISDPQALKQSESDWVITRRMCNKDVDCIRHLYGERIGQFLGSLGSKPLLAQDSQ